MIARSSRTHSRWQLAGGLTGAIAAALLFRAEAQPWIKFFGPVPDGSWLTISLAGWSLIDGPIRTGNVPLVVQNVLLWSLILGSGALLGGLGAALWCATAQRFRAIRSE
ncbi:hypothetical protein AYO44_15345 [Planctomycetaceae bacterium SCGC AG-212-F19]|nr:hypothetical protein AYO44_15345 [Planctomycetaceae bacterium SCGC AG-212-F19]